VHDQRSIILARVRRVLAERIRPSETTVVTPLSVAAWQVTEPGGIPGQGEPVPAQVALAADFTPAAVGMPWGPPWGTTWFRFRATVPPELRQAPLEAVVDLGWTSGAVGGQAEGLVFDKSGRVVKGIHPRNAWVPVQVNDKGKIRFFVEAAANPEVLRARSFAPTSVGRKDTADPTPLYRLARADLVQVHPEVRELIADLVTLLGLAEVLPETATRAWTILRALDEAMDALDLADLVATAPAGRAVLAPVLAVRAPEGTHEISAIGHAHIDSAWLWPVRETRRKVARTIADVLHLADSRPGVVFALPAAQHGAWLEEDHPDLFARLQQAVASGAVVPVGGMWVEPDGNLLSGESVCRQLTFGARWFADRLGHRCAEVWLPDSFGYSAALPQLARLAGMRWMLTQKISWNEVDRFPHHSFLWEGIDGTRIFTHFPPADTYSSELSASDLARAESAFADKGRATRSLLPFGYGDGGGGPTREMLAQADRVADLHGSPRVRLESPAAFFDRAEAEHRDPSVWVGELYLERHRGTFTSQARTKAGNRQAEALLREAELWWTTASLRGLGDYPAKSLDRLWRQVLLGQFHDILPGSSIGWVHDEIERTHAGVEAELESLIADALHALANPGVTDPANEAVELDEAVERTELDETAEPRELDETTEPSELDETHDPSELDEAAEPPEEWVSFSADPLGGDGIALGGTAYQTGGGPVMAVTVVATGTTAVLDNGRLQVTVDARGLVTSLIDLTTDREVLPPGTVGNLLQCHPDLPNAWDAWDLDPFYRNTVRDLTDADELGVESAADGSARVRVVRPVGTRGSSATQTLTLAPGAAHLDLEVDVDWRERDTILKLAWPLDVHTTEARFETQFGHVARPVHENTTWDRYRFEVPALRWVHVGEPGYGVALANARTYGWDVSRSARPGGATFVTVRASLLRGAQFPDPDADLGRHRFAFRLVPGADVGGAVAAGYALAHPARLVAGRAGRHTEPVVSVRGAIVETVKPAEDGSGALVVRLYEHLGRRTGATLTLAGDLPLDLASCHEVDLHERPTPSGDQPTAIRGVDANGNLLLTLRPFQVLTVKISPES
jgi:alpha-mannosidase